MPQGFGPFRVGVKIPGSRSPTGAPGHYRRWTWPTAAAAWARRVFARLKPGITMTPRAARRMNFTAIAPADLRCAIQPAPARHSGAMSYRLRESLVGTHRLALGNALRRRRMRFSPDWPVAYGRKSPASRGVWDGARSSATREKKWLWCERRESGGSRASVGLRAESLVFGWSRCDSVALSLRGGRTAPGSATSARRSKSGRWSETNDDRRRRCLALCACLLYRGQCGAS
jgi:hypothetical protein